MALTLEAKVLDRIGITFMYSSTQYIVFGN